MNTTWTKITKEEAVRFVEQYPVKLQHSFFMDTHGWYDFTTSKKGFDACVLRGDVNYDKPNDLEWAIRTELK